MGTGRLTTQQAGRISARLTGGRARRLAGLAASSVLTVCSFLLVTAPSPAAAVANTAFNFGPGNTWVEVNDAPQLRLSNNFTIEAWVYLQDGTNETIIDKGPTYSYLFQIYPNGQPGLGLYANYGGSHNWVYSSAVTVPTSQWSHVAVTFTNAANGLKFWVNGNLVSQHTPAGALTSYTGAMNIGRQEPGGCNCNRLQSRLDEVRIWGTARTQAQLQATMAIAPSPSTAGLVAYWDFNDGVGTTVANRTSTAGLNGTIANYSGDSQWVTGVPRAASGAVTAGIGSALDNFRHGPSAQSADDPWQYHEIPNNLTSATLLADWQKTGNEIVGHQNQWDNNRVNGAYPFVQYVHSPTTASFGGNAALMVHPDDSTRRAAVAWENTTGSTLGISVDATLKFAYPGNNSDGITYTLHRGLSGEARFSSAATGTIGAASSSTATVAATVELQAGELVYLSVGNNGNYFWDHTILTMSVSVPVPTVTSAPVITGRAEPGETLSASTGAWTGSPTSFAYQWKRASSAGGTYSNVSGATAATYTLTNADAGDYFKVAVTASNLGGAGAASLSSATSVVVAPTTTTTSTSTTVAAVSTSTTVVSSATTAAPALDIIVTGPATTAPPVGQSEISRVTTPTFAPGSGAKPAAATTTTSTTLPDNAGGTVPPEAPEVAEVGAGEAAVRVGERSETASVERVDNQLVVTAGEMSAVVAGVDSLGRVSTLDGEGNVRLQAGDKIRVSLSGFEPESPVEAWMFSTPVLLGSSVTSASGTLSATYVVPEGLDEGVHRVAVVARGDGDEPVTFTVGVLVGDWTKESNLALWLLVAPIVVAIVGALVLPATRRRRRSTAP